MSGSRFSDRLLTLAKLQPQRLALPESEDPRILAAACQLLREEVVSSLVLFGEPDSVLALAKQQSLPLVRYEKKLLWSTRDFPKLPDACRQHLALRLKARGKQPSPQELDTLGTQRLDQAAYLLSSDQVAAVVAGCVHTTADVIRAAIRGVGLAAGTRTISGAFAMVREPETGPSLGYMYSDCGVLVEPDSEQLVDIAHATALTFEALFPEQVASIAFLSFSTKGSAEHPAVDKVARAATLFRERYPAIKADGELQFDAAFDPAVGLRKAPRSPVAGRANCFIFPSLDAGNIAYKITQRLGGFSAYGPILQGTLKPFTDLSRGANVDDIFTSALIAMMRSKTQ